MSNKKEYDKGFQDGYKKAEKDIHREMDNKIKELNKKIDNTLDANEKHKEGIRNG